MKLAQIINLNEAAPYISKTQNILPIHGKHEFLKTEDEITAWLKSMGVKKFVIVEDGKNFKVDASGHVDLTKKNLSYIPVQFGVIDGSFSISNNPNLESLKGCPEEVTAKFSCAMNRKITSLEFGPKKVGGLYNIRQCSLTDLKGAPEEVGGNFNAFGNGLKSLVGGPKKIGADYAVYYNNLVSLEGIPEYVGRTINLSKNKITKLDHFPKHIGGSIDLDANKLSSVKDVVAAIPKSISGTLNLSNNPFKGGLMSMFTVKCEKVIFYVTNISSKLEYLAAAGKIINTHLWAADDEKTIFDVQEELIDAGLDEFAQV